MKKIGLLVIVLLLSGVVFGQTKAEKKAAKKAKKEAKLKREIANADTLVAIMESKQFVLEAHTLYDKKGQNYVLSPNINFVAFDGDNSTIQLAFQNLVGWNGVGGITLDGKVTLLEVDRKPGETSFNVNARVKNKGGGGMTMMFFRVSSEGFARVEMNGSFGERISFQGRIVPLSESSVYKGMPVY